MGLPQWLRDLGVKELFVSEGTHGVGLARGTYFPGLSTPYDKPVSIEISRRLKPVSRYEVFLHELIHVLHPDWVENRVNDEVVRTLVILEIPITLNEYGYPMLEEFPDFMEERHE